MENRDIEAVALTVRSLTMDAVEKAGSGHPGMPMGMAELGALLYGVVLRHNPAEPDWIDRDRFVLSAGHGSMLLYALLHLAGYDLPLEEIKSFRQLGSKTAGHPEYRAAPGIETTTGPLGQGFANAVGMAVAERMLAHRFNTPEHTIIDHHTYVISGDGCMMEGVTAEAASLAGHLGLGKLIAFYDDNSISIEGSTDLAFTEDVGKRFEGYNWHVCRGDAYDTEGILRRVEQAKAEADRPSLIRLTSTIGRGAPSKAGSHETHGAPLGEEEVAAAKKALGIPGDQPFYIHPGAVEFFSRRRGELEKEHVRWESAFSAWAGKNPELHQQWKAFFAPAGRVDVELPAFPVGEKVATRAAGGKVLNAFAKAVPNLVGGAADLAPSTKTLIADAGDFQRDNPGGRNMRFGVREHGMGAVTNGMALHGGLRPFCSTFFVFTDYMRPPVRLASMMGLAVIYVFTHDSIYVGEDGPTHEPVEHLAAMRAVPGLTVLRPGDAEETALAWLMAIENTDGPTALVLTRQKLEVYPKADESWRETARLGAYTAREAEGNPRIVVIATGSEVSLAVKAAEAMGAAGAGVRVVSMICRERFLAAPEDYRRSLVPSGAKRLVVEAGVSLGWEGMAGEGGDILSIERFGESGPAAAVAEHLGFTVESVRKRIESLLG